MFPTAEQCMDYATAPGGPLHHENAIHGVLQPHRTHQADAGRRLGAFVDKALKHPDICLQYAEIGGGVGKTYLDVLLAFFTFLLHDDYRVMISTSTTALRSDLMQIEASANRVVEETCRHFAIPYFPVVMAERVASTGFISPAQVDALDKSILAGQGAGEPAAVAHAWAFIQFSRLDPLGRFSDWFDLPIADGRLPFDRAQTSLCLSVDDKPDKENPVQPSRYALVRAMHDKADLAHVVLVTHAMLGLNNIYGGKALLTRRQVLDDLADDTPNAKRTRERQGDSRFGLLICDEADKLGAAAAGMGVTSLSLTDTRSSLQRMPTLINVSAALGALDRLHGTLTKARNGQSSGRIVPTDTLAGEFRVNVAALASELRQIVKMASGIDIAEFDVEMLDFDAANLAMMADFGLALPGAKPFEVAAAARQVVEYRPGHAGNTDGSILIRQTKTQWRTAVLFSPKRKHSFEAIILMSATLRGANGDFHLLERSLGIQSPNPGLAGGGNYIKHHIDPPIDIVPVGYGRNSLLVLGDRNLHPTDPSDPELINRAQVLYAARCIALRSSQCLGAHDRILVPCTSYAYQTALVDALVNVCGVNPSLLLTQRAGQRPQALIRELAKTPGGILIGMFWEGINPVDPTTGVTLIKTIIVPRLPVMPSMSAIDPDSKWVMFEVIDQAYQRLIQVIYRGIRNPTDQVEVWILDNRFPIPSAARNRLGLPTATSRAAAPFQNFGTAIRLQSTQANPSRRLVRVFDATKGLSTAVVC